MTNPQDVGNYDNWIIDRILFGAITNRILIVGNFDTWIMDRIWFDTYTRFALPKRMEQEILP